MMDEDDGSQVKQRRRGIGDTGVGGVWLIIGSPM